MVAKTKWFDITATAVADEREREGGSFAAAQVINVFHLPLHDFIAMQASFVTLYGQ